MQHFVVNEVFNRMPGHPFAIEYPADDDGVVCGIVMPQAAQRMLAAPGHLRSRHQAVEEAAVEVFENFFQMVVVAAGGVDVLASAKLADEAREIEKANDSVLRRPHAKDGRLISKTKLLEKPQ